MQKNKSALPDQFCVEEQVSEEAEGRENETEMMDTAPVQQQQVITDDQSQLT